MADFETLVDQIYEAAADPDLWSQALHSLGGAVDAAGGALFIRRNDAWRGWCCSVELKPRFEAFVTSEAIAQTKATARLVGAKRAGFIAEQEVFTSEEYLADPMMTEWGTPAGLHHAAATAIHVPTGDLVVVQVNRRKGQPRFGRDDIARLDAIRPHLARAGLLAARWRLQRLRAAAEALAMIGLPAAILDARGKVLAANALIEAMMSHLMWLPKDRIALIDPGANALLERAVADISSPDVTSVRSFPAMGATMSDPVVVHLVPTTGRASDLFGGGFGLLVITAVVAPDAPDAALLRGLFDLTPAEARVASGIAEGLSVNQIASRNKVASETVRAQIKAVFAKTGVNRQSQVAALLAAVPRIPIRNQSSF
jgi:DNA-binding CsgD family transcriptional regulator